MATATVIHFGIDECQLVQVLRQAGYKVHELASLDQLRLHLEGVEDLDAVIVSQSEPHCVGHATDLVRQHSGAPLILFRCSDVVLDESRFDRVYSVFTPTSHWLFETAVLVMQAKELRAQSEALRFGRIR
jgi:hypothetical protein